MSAAAARRDADVVGAGHDPGRRLPPRRSSRPRARRRRAACARAARRSSSSAMASPVARPREHAARLRPALEPAHDRVAPDVGPAADDDAQDLLAGGLLERRARALHAGVLEPLCDLVARRSASPAHTIRTGNRLPRARSERLRERAHHRRVALRRLPRGGPTTRARRRRPGARPPRRAPRSVHVVEPVDPPAALATAADSVDLLHEPAAVARLDLRSCAGSRRITVSPSVAFSCRRPRAARRRRSRA